MERQATPLSHAAPFCGIQCRDTGMCICVERVQRGEADSAPAVQLTENTSRGLSTKTYNARDRDPVRCQTP